MRTLERWIRRRKDNCLPPKKRRSSPSKIDDEKLYSFIQKYPDAYLREIAEEFGVTLQAIFYACKRLKLSVKKRGRIIKKETSKKEKNF